MAIVNGVFFLLLASFFAFSCWPRRRQSLNESTAPETTARRLIIVIELRRQFLAETSRAAQLRRSAPPFPPPPPPPPAAPAPSGTKDARAVELPRRPPGGASGRSGCPRFHHVVSVAAARWRYRRRCCALRETTARRRPRPRRNTVDPLRPFFLLSSFSNQSKKGRSRFFPHSFFLRRPTTGNGNEETRNATGAVRGDLERRRGGGGGASRWMVIGLFLVPCCRRLRPPMRSGGRAGLDGTQRPSATNRRRRHCTGFLLPSFADGLKVTFVSTE